MNESVSITEFDVLELLIKEFSTVDEVIMSLFIIESFIFEFDFIVESVIVVLSMTELFM